MSSAGPSGSNIATTAGAPDGQRREASSAAAKKTIAHPECQVCEWQPICRGGCPKHRHDRYRRFEDLDYFCSAYKTIYAKSVPPLRKEVAGILARRQAPVR